MGRKRLQKLIEAGLVTDLPSLFMLQEAAVAAVPGFSRSTAKRIIAALRTASHPDSFKFVTALGIPGVGSKSVQRLAHQFTSLDTVLTADEGRLKILSAVDARAVLILQSFFHSSGGAELLAKFRELGMLPVLNGVAR